MENFTAWIKSQQDINVWACIHFQCDEDILWKRIQSRLSGRSDDNEESFRKRIQVYKTSTEEVLNQFGQLKKLIKINSTAPLSTVYENIVKELTLINQWLYILHQIMKYVYSLSVRTNITVDELAKIKNKNYITQM